MVCVEMDCVINGGVSGEGNAVGRVRASVRVHRFSSEPTDQLTAAASIARIRLIIISYHFENLYFIRMNISGSKTNVNNKLSNLTININSQHIQHLEVGDTWNYTEQNNLWLWSVILYNYVNLEIA